MKRNHSATRSKGSKPSGGVLAPNPAPNPAPNRHLDMATPADAADSTTEAEPSPTIAENQTLTHAFHSHSHAKSTATSEESNERTPISKERSACLPAGSGAGGAAGGCGGRGAGVPGRAGNARGPHGQTQSGFGIGSRVRNASGRGVWGFGSIVGVIPAGTRPRWYCRRHGLPLVFGERCAPVWRDRYIVLGDDGRLHSPRNVEVCDGERG